MQSFCFPLHLLIYSSWRHFVFCYFRPLTLFPAAALFSYFYLIFKKIWFHNICTFFSPQFILFSFVSVWMFESARVPHLNECYLFVLRTQVLVQEKKKACLFTNVIWWAGSLLNSGKLLLMPLENRDNAANLNYRKNVKKKKIFLYWEIINN